MADAPVGQENGQNSTSTSGMVRLPSPPEQPHRRDLNRSGDITDRQAASSSGRQSHDLPTSVHGDSFLAERIDGATTTPMSSHGSNLPPDPNLSSTDTESDRPRTTPMASNDHSSEDRGTPSHSNHSPAERQRPSRKRTKVHHRRRRPTERSISPNERFLRSLSQPSEFVNPTYRNIPHATWDGSEAAVKPRSSNNANRSTHRNNVNPMPPSSQLTSADLVQSENEQRNADKKNTTGRRDGLLIDDEGQKESQNRTASGTSTSDIDTITSEFIRNDQRRPPTPMPSAEFYQTDNNEATANNDWGIAERVYDAFRGHQALMPSPPPLPRPTFVAEAATPVRQNKSSMSSWTSTTNVLSQTNQHDDRSFFGFSVPTMAEYNDILNATPVEKESRFDVSNKRSKAYQLTRASKNRRSDQPNTSSVDSRLHHHRNPTYTAQYIENSDGQLQWMYAGADTSSDDVTTSTSNSSAAEINAGAAAARSLGIFERDVEAANEQQQFQEAIELSLRRLDGFPRQHGTFPLDVLTALGHDGDAIAQATVQWDKSFLPPGYCPSTDSNQSICRICHSGESYEGLLNPCKCSGSVKWIHQTCLVKWLAECGIVNCELCGYKYKFRRTGSKNCLRWKPIALDINDKLHLFLLFFASAFLIVTLAFVIWVTLSKHKKAVSERQDAQSEIVFPIYSCLDAVALGIICFELKHNTRRLYQKWRAKNMGLVVMTRKIEPQENGGDHTPPTEEGAVISDPRQSPPQQSGLSLDDGYAPVAITSYVASHRESNVHYETL